MSPRSGPFPVRCWVSAVGRAPLTGTSHSRGAEVPGARQLARIVLLFHHRAGEQVPPPGTGRDRVAPVEFVTSSTPWAPLTARAVPSGEEMAVLAASCGPEARVFSSLPARS